MKSTFNKLRPVPSSRDAAQQRPIPVLELLLVLCGIALLLQLFPGVAHRLIDLFDARGWLAWMLRALAALANGMRTIADLRFWWRMSAGLRSWSWTTWTWINLAIIAAIYVYRNWPVLKASADKSRAAKDRRQEALERQQKIAASRELRERCEAARRHRLY